MFGTSLRHPFTTRGLFSDNPGSACPGAEHWNDEVNPTAEDLEYFEELAEQWVRSRSWESSGVHPSEIVFRSSSCDSVPAASLPELLSFFCEAPNLYIVSSFVLYSLSFWCTHFVIPVEEHDYVTWHFVYRHICNLLYYACVMAGCTVGIFSSCFSTLYSFCARG